MATTVVCILGRTPDYGGDCSLYTHMHLLNTQEAWHKQQYHRQHCNMTTRAISSRTVILPPTAAAVVDVFISSIGLLLLYILLLMCNTFDELVA